MLELANVDPKPSRQSEQFPLECQHPVATARGSVPVSAPFIERAVILRCVFTGLLAYLIAGCASDPYDLSGVYAGKVLKPQAKQMNSDVTLTPELAPEVVRCLRRALAEDIGPGDVTTDSIVPAGATLRGEIIARETGVIAGLDIAQTCFCCSMAQSGLYRMLARENRLPAARCWQIFPDRPGHC